MSFLTVFMDRDAPCSMVEAVDTNRQRLIHSEKSHDGKKSAGVSDEGLNVQRMSEGRNIHTYGHFNDRKEGVKKRKHGQKATKSSVFFTIDLFRKVDG